MKVSNMLDKIKIYVQFLEWKAYRSYWQPHVARKTDKNSEYDDWSALCNWLQISANYFLRFDKDFSQTWLSKFFLWTIFSLVIIGKFGSVLLGSRCIVDWQNFGCHCTNVLWSQEIWSTERQYCSADKETRTVETGNSILILTNCYLFEYSQWCDDAWKQENCCLK